LMKMKIALRQKWLYHCTCTSSKNLKPTLLLPS
jgi:hypothetical protein